MNSGMNMKNFLSLEEAEQEREADRRKGYDVTNIEDQEWPNAQWVGPDGKVDPITYQKVFVYYCSMRRNPAAVGRA